MGLGGVDHGGVWLWMFAGVPFVVGIVVLVVWAIGVAVGRPDEDDALTLLRARFARGEIDATSFEQARQTLGSARRSGARSRMPAIVAIALVAIALVAGGLTPAAAGRGFGGLGPGMMGSYGVAPTAPAGTSVRMAGSRFEPATLTIAPGQTVRWFNDDVAPHTVSAKDGSWDSGNLSPGASFERRFEAQGSYPYVCVYHPGMAGTVEVQVTAP